MFSGFVAAYAIGRPGFVNTLAGVAIAAALVPPLCVVGIGLTNGQPFVAANSAILLLTNLVAIILSAAMVFSLLGIRGVDITSTLGDDEPAGQEVVEAYLESVPEVSLMTIARVSVEPTSSISILLLASGEVPAGTKDDLTRLVHEVRGGDPTVRIVVLREVLEQ